MQEALKPVVDYYSAKVRAHGATPRGADWNGAESQELRFAQLLQLLPATAHAFSLDDYGCGYGALLDYLRNHGRTDIDYFGIDLAAPMIAAAQARHANDQARFHLGNTSPRRAHYAVASGIFNVSLGAAVHDWEQHFLATLDKMHAATERGFAFNCLTSYSDPERRQDHLYYGDPCFYFDLCKRRYARNVALLHDYGLYEFTILVRKDP